jgi:hypothetical protein
MAYLCISLCMTLLVVFLLNWDPIEVAATPPGVCFLLNQDKPETYRGGYGY